ncbi:glucose-1-phosphate thymidylyltransferase [Fervidicella metallireducens AeB]|uniref:Glucose-1-phosphate thymidylyltransferase n=1 Tax=Fervidicella metallireducens AeB TaxID=1403537 RepID=A0A017RXD5_9CLOT|nr:glucose-1-phosphate thymidylyltransferase RfbA [Fervidicella metallireducens]EYE89443.1 glucose-1-phosphate thymidylyltransferase [Fervidicella metallireducens AeB]
MKGIILAGGAGTRLYPVTKAVSKSLLAVYDKPMIYYPLSVLLLCGIKDILIISTPEDIGHYKKLLSDGGQLGINISYEIQEKPEGIGHAFIVGREFIGMDKVALILGDNIFYGKNLKKYLKSGIGLKEGATVFGYETNTPKDFGIIELDKNGNPVSIQEKPKYPKSNLAVPGLYFYDNDVVKVALETPKSSRGEIEITSINNYYLTLKKLKVEVLDKSIKWFDTGTHEGLLNAANFIRKVQKRYKKYIASVEETAYLEGYINKEKLCESVWQMKNSEYGKYLINKYCGKD